MKVEALQIPEVKLIVPDIFRDDRGFFSETYNSERLAAAGIDATFVQDNHSQSRAKGVVRGLHLQIEPFAQGKLVRVARGAIFDVAVDLRYGSPTFGRHVSAEVSAANWAQLWIPPGFAHGYCTLEPDTEVIYKVTTHYSAAHERAIRWDDPSIGIAWPVCQGEAILSPKDVKAQPLAQHPAYFQYKQDGKG
jgi:dTDP-4-dehydrorhamnose 3,5-epimerase